MRNRKFLNIALIILVALGLGFYNLPGETQKNLVGFTPNAIADSKVNLGLDLQGGSQLDYKIDLSRVPDNQRQSTIDGIINVINKRVNGLGVSEPNIYTSIVGNEHHIIVELAGIKDLNQAKEVVGKTIQLEFKKERETPDPTYQEKVKKQAEELLAKVKNGDFKVIGEEQAQANPTQITYSEDSEFKFADQLSEEAAAEVFKVEPGKTVDKLIETSGNYTFVNGQLIQQTGFDIYKVLAKQNVDREINTSRSVKIRHILISYKGSDLKDESVTRSEEEAKKLADEVFQKLKNNEKFEDLAKQYSDDKSNKENGGALEAPAVEGQKDYVDEFQAAALGLKAKDELTGPVKTVYGYHIIKADEVQEAKNEKRNEPQVKLAKIFISTLDDQWESTGLTGQQFQRADVQFTNTYQPHVTITFTAEGAKMFEELTEKNVGKRIAIFVGGEMISDPVVNEKIVGGQAVITSNFTIDTAQELARDLNTGAIPAPISLAGQYTIGASLGQDALAKSVQAGIIGFILVAIFMVIFYRLPGLLAAVALFAYTMILLFLIKVALPLTIALPIAIAVFIYLIMKILNAKDSGPEKLISLILACFILFFLTFLLGNQVVLTLAGIAGVILSIGMAVDANILIFERIKEELRDGRNLKDAIEVGFDRAWNSIRDSNFSSLITCAILFYLGSSIIQGFAFNLAAGILVSMFTAITITKTLLLALTNTKLAGKTWLFGNPKKKEKVLLPIIPKRKFWYIISVVLLIGSLISLPIFGLKAGLDFTGGTLMEIQFEKKPTNEELQKALAEAEKTINDQITATQTTQENTNQNTIINQENAKLDMGQPHIVSTGDSVIIKSKHINNTQHDALIGELTKKFGNLEEKRFVTVGPTVGSSMQYKAFLAVLIASVMIIVYIAFAFRKVPRSVGKWRFGLSAIIALLHDLAIMIGIYVYLGGFLGLEIDALFITALLTVMGFSVHDTIVVFDRIREKLKYQKKDETFEEIANNALNETIGRSINTSATVVLSLLALVLFGGESIRYFNLALLIGIICGTFSSIFVASPILVDWFNYSQKKK